MRRDRPRGVRGGRAWLRRRLSRRGSAAWRRAAAVRTWARARLAVAERAQQPAVSSTARRATGPALTPGSVPFSDTATRSRPGSRRAASAKLTSGSGARARRRPRRPRIASSNRAASSTLRARPPNTVSPCQCSGSGSVEMRPRVGLSPNSPHRRRRQPGWRHRRRSPARRAPGPRRCRRLSRRLSLRGTARYPTGCAWLRASRLGDVAPLASSGSASCRASAPRQRAGAAPPRHRRGRRLVAPVP